MAPKAAGKEGAKKKAPAGARKAKAKHDRAKNTAHENAMQRIRCP